jgi:NDP-sugar pyrophosphorylase family protein
MRAIVMAGGQGLRLRPYTSILPKPLIPLSGMPILEIILRQLYYYGFYDITLTLNYRGEIIRSYFGSGEKLGLNITYVDEEKIMGTVGSLNLINHFNEPCLLINADILTDVDYCSLFNHHLSSDAALTIMIVPLTSESNFGVVSIDSKGLLTDYSEKPRRTEWVSSGIYSINTDVLQYLNRDRMDMPELIQNIIRSQSHWVNTYIHNGIWNDIGNIVQLQEANSCFEENKDHLLKHGNSQYKEE